ncbi:hypothetical protein [Prevotella sp.]|uniref:hypothetical protein n=1 Tax=Prevotella sp. TaxID=59823 RepID=UPI002F93F5C5
MPHKTSRISKDKQINDYQAINYRSANPMRPPIRSKGHNAPAIAALSPFQSCAMTLRKHHFHPTKALLLRPDTYPAEA